MKTGTVIGILVATAAVGGIGYVVYKRMQGGSGSTLNPTQPGAFLPSRTPVPVNPSGSSTTTEIPSVPKSTTNAPLSTLAQYEKMGLRNIDTGKVYLVENGQLRDVIGWSGWDKTGWPSRSYEALIESGYILPVDTAFINRFPQGAPLSGLPAKSMLV